MPRKRPAKPKSSKITYLTPQGEMSSSPGKTGLPPGIKSKRTAPPSRAGTIYFERRSAIPRKEDIALLLRHARRLVANPRSRLLIQGYSNSRRADDGARKLARSRAVVVRRLLLTLGAKERQLETAVGDIHRVTATTSSSSRAKNRRVELSAKFWDDGIALLPSMLAGMRSGARSRRRAA